MNKRKGQRFQYAEEFEKDLLQTYMRVRKEHLDRYGRINQFAVQVAVANSPAKRFYTSPEQAWRVIRSMMHNRPLAHPPRPLAKEMYVEIYSRVLAERRRYPNKPLSYIIEDVLDQPAPKFYITPAAVGNKLSSMKTTHRSYERTGKYSKKGKEK